MRGGPRRAGVAGTVCVDVDITEPGTRVVVRSIGDLAKPLDQDLLDRVGALGGTATLHQEGREWSVEVWLPCGS